VSKGGPVPKSFAHHHRTISRRKLSEGAETVALSFVVSVSG
jgi:hypothetical protein